MTYFTAFSSVVKHQLGSGWLLQAAGTGLAIHQTGLKGPVCTDWQEGKKAAKLKYSAKSDANI